MIVVLSWREWLADLRVERAADEDLDQVRAHVDAMPSDRTAFVFDVARPLDVELDKLSYSGPRLVEIYNATLGSDDQRVAKFQDRATALRRIGLRLVGLARAAPALALTPPPTKENEDMPREARIGEFRPVRPSTNLGKIIVAHRAGTTQLGGG